MEKRFHKWQKFLQYLSGATFTNQMLVCVNCFCWWTKINKMAAIIKLIVVFIYSPLNPFLYRIFTIVRRIESVREWSCILKKNLKLLQQQKLKKKKKKEAENCYGGFAKNTNAIVGINCGAKFYSYIRLINIWSKGWHNLKEADITLYLMVKGS